MLTIIALVLAALVSGFLCLAGFEYPGVTAWKLTTGSLSTVFLALAVVLARSRKPR